MAAEFVTNWLMEKKPDARVTDLGVDEDGVHVWDVQLPGKHEFRLGIHSTVLDDEGLLAERLMELETQGRLDDAGEKDLWLLVAGTDISDGLAGTGKPPRSEARSRSTRERA